MTSSFVMRMQPDETACPIVSGSLEPWRRSGAQKKAGHEGGADQVAAHDSPRKTVDDQRTMARPVPDSTRRGVIMARTRPYAMRSARPGITNWSIGLNCCQEDTSNLRAGAYWIGEGREERRQAAQTAA